jgi:tetratricopeptide (TPR) repeat protein
VGPVTEQSEHLSGAQIENYGNRTSGAEPESAQRDEHQRVHHQSTGDQNSDQSIDDQRVEAHLADCPSCRNRVLDFHRRLFAPQVGPPETDLPEDDPTRKDASLTGPRSAGSNEGSADSKLASAIPTDSALADSNFANPKYPADPQVRTAPTPECPSDDALRHLAAGLLPDASSGNDALAATLLQHTATCDHCGPLLRTFTEDFSDDFTPEEQAALANLQSSSADWQKNTAQKMLEAGGVQAAVAPAADGQSSLRKSSTKATTEPKPFFWKWVLVPATAAVVVLAAITFPVYLARRDSPEKVAKLEAQAFSEQRTTEMRIPYAAYADFNQKRSGDTPSRSSLPQSLNLAADKISKHLQKEPDDPQWLMLSARLDLWDSNYKAALSSLERISDSQAIQSPEYLMTRAFALFQKSEALKESQGYSEAVDLLDKALQKAPNDPVLLFNQAIACEKIHSYGCAENDWNRLLAVEKDPQWTAEARKHLDQIREKKTPAH